MKQRHTNNEGFTIIELMIASAVFTMVLLLSTFAILNIGRTYYKGVTATRTQETARAVMEEITDSIRFGGAEIRTLETKDDIHGFCIGDVKFSYVLDAQLVEQADDIKAKGEPADVQPPNTSTSVLKKTTPCDGVASLAGGTELLKLRMRLDDFSVQSIPGNPGVYRVVVRVVHGDTDLLEEIGGAEGDGPWQCKNERAGSEYCAVSELITTVERRI